ncbi:hypothetical protein QBC38DRAFT_450731 [Podospora fimiseda]|uniref:Secreted protein n=1 Tax=Podospora fimiseda TaxID=252190 RepID=A0AAN7BZ39_9PEZI|nr:hypothetical protein QBC38DRAFT_450731 [Podospora fimiseda]
MKLSKFLSTITLFLTGAHGLATSPPARRAEDTADIAKSPVPEGFTVVDLEWTVETTPGGPTVTLNGTVEQVHDKLLEINPNWDQDFAPIIAKRNAEAAAAAAQDTTPAGSNALTKRDWTVCGEAGHGHGGASMGAIETGVAYLRTLAGQAQRGPGPRSCGQVSCSWHAAIWYCNNNSYTKYMPWVHIANAGQVLLDSCSYFDWAVLGYRTRGERWHDDGWFVIVSENYNCNKYS